MKDFKLDPRLANDCIVLGKLDFSFLLLMNNSLIPWFILVPECSETEIMDLPHSEQARLLREINIISSFTKSNFEIMKLNIAAIGNIVSQLHIHIIGRNHDDFCWPNVVWGSTEKVSYTTEQVLNISSLLINQLGKDFSTFS